MRQRLVFDSEGKAHWVDKNKVRSAPVRANEAPIKEDFSLGCIKTQVDEMRAAAEVNGIKGVEWKEDPDVPGWYDLYAENQRAQAKVVKMCGIPDKNGARSGAMITAREIELAEKLARRQKGSVA